MLKGIKEEEETTIELAKSEVDYFQISYILEYPSYLLKIDWKVFYYSPIST